MFGSNSIFHRDIRTVSSKLYFFMFLIFKSTLSIAVCDQCLCEHDDDDDCFFLVPVVPYNEEHHSQIVVQLSTIERGLQVGFNDGPYEVSERRIEERYSSEIDQIRDRCNSQMIRTFRGVGGEDCMLNTTNDSDEHQRNSQMVLKIINDSTRSEYEVVNSNESIATPGNLVRLWSNGVFYGGIWFFYRHTEQYFNLSWCLGYIIYHQSGDSVILNISPSRESIMRYAMVSVDQLFDGVAVLSHFFQNLVPQLAIERPDIARNMVYVISTSSRSIPRAVDQQVHASQRLPAIFQLNNNIRTIRNHLNQRIIAYLEGNYANIVIVRGYRETGGSQDDSMSLFPLPVRSHLQMLVELGDLTRENSQTWAEFIRPVDRSGLVGESIRRHWLSGGRSGRLSMCYIVRNGSHEIEGSVLGLFYAAFNNTVLIRLYRGRRHPCYYIQVPADGFLGAFLSIISGIMGEVSGIFELVHLRRVGNELSVPEHANECVTLRFTHSL